MFSNIKKNTAILSVIWLLFLLLHLHLYGIVSDLEADKYIKEAHNLLESGTLSAPRFWFYSITILIISLSLKINAGIIGAIIIQSAFNLFALITFFYSIRNIFKSEIFPLAITSLLIAFTPYSSWNVFLFTESAFYSCILLLLASLISYNYHKSRRSLCYLVIAMAAVILARPLGVLLAIGLVVYFWISFPRRIKLLVIPIAVLFCSILVAITNIVFTTTTDATMIRSAEEGCVICGVLPETAPQPKLKTSGPPLIQFSYYIKHNTEAFADLAIKRLKAFFLMTRPYYSQRHNTFILVFIIPLYLLSAFNLRLLKDKEYSPIFFFMLVSILAFAFAVMIQCDDYHNRFVLGLFPFFLIMSAKSIEYFFRKKTSRQG